MTIRRTPNSIATIIAFVCVLGMAAPSGAVPYLESSYGGQSAWFSAEVNALGGTGAGTYRGGVSTVLNPAGLAQARAWRFDAGLSLAHHQEERFAPLYDSFDSFVDDISIASNQNTWAHTGFAVAGQIPLGEQTFAVGISLTDRAPFDYRFEEEIRDPDVFSSPRDRILEERSYEVEGTLRTLSLGIAGESDRLRMGASVHYAFGERTAQWLVRDNDMDDGDGSLDIRDAWDLSGVNATVGLQVDADERLTLGFAYETPLTVDGDVTGDVFTAASDTTISTVEKHHLRYPARWRFGAAFFPRHEPRTILTVDVIYAAWSEFEDSRNDDLWYLQDVVDVRIGLQHSFQSGQDMRFGFRRYDSYADNDGGNSVFSAGAGWPVGPGRLAASLELNKLQTDGVVHIFDYPADFVSPPTARVDDLRLRFGLGWSQTF